MAVERSPLAKVDDITLVHMAHSGEDAPCLVWKCPCAVMCHIRSHESKVAPSSGSDLWTNVANLGIGVDCDDV